MDVKYWWTDDGDMEICSVRQQDGQDYICYHCGQRRLATAYVLKLVVSGEEYILCKRCFQQSCEIMT